MFCRQLLKRVDMRNCQTCLPSIYLNGGCPLLTHLFPYRGKREASFSRTRCEGLWWQLFGLVLDTDSFSGYLFVSGFCLGFQETQLDSSSRRKRLSERQLATGPVLLAAFLLALFPHHGNLTRLLRFTLSMVSDWDDVPEAAQLETATSQAQAWFQVQLFLMWKEPFHPSCWGTRPLLLHLVVFLFMNSLKAFS